MEDQKKERADGQAVKPEGNDEWFARGAGVDDQPFERTWRGGRRPDDEKSRTRLSVGSPSQTPVLERRTTSRRDIAHDPFVKRISEERRAPGGDRRSRRGPGVREDRPSRFQ